MQPITMTVCNRPEYTQRVLDALQRCRGIEDHILLVRAEPGFPEVEKVLQSYRYPASIITNTRRLGCNANTLAAIDAGFAVSDWVIHVEDDTVPAVDALEFMAWARTQHNLACCYRGPGASDYGNMSGTVWDRWFFPWVWGCSKDLWERHRQCVRCDSPRSWDTQVSDSLAQSGELLQLCPAWARSLNIGAEGGVHVPSAEWHRLNHLNMDWIGMEERNPVRWDDPGEKPKAPKGFKRLPSWRRQRQS
jgi:hypothetical protein